MTVRRVRWERVRTQALLGRICAGGLDFDKFRVDDGYEIAVGHGLSIQVENRHK
jgi:hypothetical protein